MLLITALIRNFRAEKLKSIIFVVALFTILYMGCDQSEFSGLGKLEKEIESIRDSTAMSSIDRPLAFFENLFDKLYFTIITTSTVGYGDIYPQSLRTRILVLIHTSIMLYITFS